MLRNRNFKICLIASVDSVNFGIGFNGQVLYSVKEDFQRFKRITTTTSDSTKMNAILMGRKTYLSIGKALPRRINLIISSNQINNILDIFPTPEKAEEYCHKLGNIETLFVIGGQQLYQHYIDIKRYDSIDLTFFTSISPYKPIVDTFFPRFPYENHHITKSESFDVISKNGYLKMQHIQFDRIVNLEEERYLNVLREVYENGDIRQTRNSITKSLFGRTLSFDLSEGRIPLLTTKRVFFKGVLKELLWFLDGQTDAKLLQKDNVNIWNGNTSKEFLDKVNLSHLVEGDIGPLYGYTWRHWGYPYEGCDKDYKGKGIDQIQQCLDLIKKDPNSRRIVFSGWNVSELDNAVLNPCHVLYQFYVNDGKLSCQMTQRSGDLFLGVPFNIASVSLLTCIFAHFCDLKPGIVTICLGDCHIYENHIDAVKEQIGRKPYEFPLLEIIGDKPEKIEDYKFEQFEIQNYKCLSAIKAKMIA
jgi:dihydrofolate reductase/thymidylate synthase